MEEQFKQLTRDYDNAQKNYRGTAGQEEFGRLDRQDEHAGAGRAHVRAESRQPAGFAELSESAAFCGAAGWRRGWRWGSDWRSGLKIQDKAIRTESDAEAVLQLPTLVAVPWVSGEAADGKNVKFKFWNWKKTSNQHKEEVGV